MKKRENIIWSWWILLKLRHAKKEDEVGTKKIKECKKIDNFILQYNIK